MQSPRDIAIQHPQAKKDDFLKLFSEYQGKTARIPRVRDYKSEQHLQRMVSDEGLFYFFSRSWRGCKNHLWRNKAILFSVSLFSIILVVSNDPPLFSPPLPLSPPQVTYPLLRNKQEWTKADGEHCSAWTQKHPNTCLLDSKWQQFYITSS